MKKNLIIAALMAATSLSATQAFAASGQVKFTGSITDVACTVTNNPSAPLDVKLGEYGTNEFSGADQLTAKLSFKLGLTNCPATIKTAAVTFDGVPDTANSGLLKVEGAEGDDVADGVAIALFDKAGKALPLNTASDSYDIVEGANELTFMAAYQSTAESVTPGSANGTANFSIVYN